MEAVKPTNNGTMKHDMKQNLCEENGLCTLLISREVKY